MATDTNANRQGVGTSSPSSSSGLGQSSSAGSGSAGGSASSGSGAASEASARMSDAANKAGDKARDAAGRASGFASRAAAGIAGEAQHKVSGLLQGQIEAGADYVAMIAETAESAADDLEDKAPELARMVRDAADRTSQFAEDFRHRSAEEMMDAAVDFARTNPRMFFGGAIAAGFLLSRFLKSGGSRGASRRRVRTAGAGTHGSGGTNYAG